MRRAGGHGQQRCRRLHGVRDGSMERVCRRSRHPNIDVGLGARREKLVEGKGMRDNALVIIRFGNALYTQPHCVTLAVVTSVCSACDHS